MKLLYLFYNIIQINLLIRFSSGILFPEFSVLQIVAAVSWPCDLPVRKVFMNIGFQFNYALPFQLDQLFNPVYWQRSLLTSNDDDHNSNNINDTINKHKHLNKIKTKPKNSTNTRKRIKKKGKQKPRRSLNDIGNNELLDDNNNDLAKKDMSAGELYQIVENYSESFGYHKTCLLKSVCQLARHPLDIGEDEHLLAEVLQFLLTPTVHQAFTKDEQYDKERYEMAEFIGTQGGDCEIIYHECQGSLLDYITFITDTNNNNNNI